MPPKPTRWESTNSPSTLLKSLPSDSSMPFPPRILSFDRRKNMKSLEILIGFLRAKFQVSRIREAADLAGPSPQPELWNPGLAFTVRAA